MATKTLEALYLDELSELLEAEAESLRLLSRLQDATRTPALRDALRKHGNESRLHVERLELIFTHWGTRACQRRCLGMAGISEQADHRLHDAATVEVNDVVIIAVARRMEHYEMACYGVARMLAQRLNRSDEARLLQETLDDEARADGRLAEIAQANGSHSDPGRVPVSAAAAMTPSPGTELR
jgi:ferritin-like metal-binding protein YciE